MMDLDLDRTPSTAGTTFGQLFIDKTVFCKTLEDEIRELPGIPVEQWKVPDYTCIPSGRYRITMENSPRFGPDTITVNDVPGFTAIRVHGGNDKDDTEGCIIVGDQINREQGTISGAQARGVLKRLKERIHAGLQDGGEIWLTINNP